MNKRQILIEQTFDLPAEKPLDMRGVVQNSGLYYKLGARGFCFTWTGYEWVKSERPWADVKDGIHGKPLQSHAGKHAAG